MLHESFEAAKAKAIITANQFGGFVTEYGPGGMFIERTSTSVSYVRWLKITNGTRMHDTWLFFRLTEEENGWRATEDTEDEADRLININLKLAEEQRASPDWYTDDEDPADVLAEIAFEAELDLRVQNQGDDDIPF